MDPHQDTTNKYTDQSEFVPLHPRIDSGADVAREHVSDLQRRAVQMPTVMDPDTVNFIRVPANAGDTIQNANVAQNVFNRSKHGRVRWFFQNQSAANMFLRTDGQPATADYRSKRVPPGGEVWENQSEGGVTPERISVICATAGAGYYAEEVT